MIQTFFTLSQVFDEFSRYQIFLNKEEICKRNIAADICGDVARRRRDSAFEGFKFLS